MTAGTPLHVCSRERCRYDKACLKTGLGRRESNIAGTTACVLPMPLLAGGPPKRASRLTMRKAPQAIRAPEATMFRRCQGFALRQTFCSLAKGIADQRRG